MNRLYALAQNIFKFVSMKSFKTLLFLLAIALIAASCESKAQKQTTPEEEILAVNKVLLDSTQHIIHANAEKYVQLTQEFIHQGTDPKKVLKYAIQGAEVAVNIGEHQKAIQTYDLLIAQFKDEPKVVSNALFAKAFILENHLQKIEDARKIYESILEKYPNQAISKTIQATLQNLGKSDKELIEMIKNKNK